MFSLQEYEDRLRALFEKHQSVQSAGFTSASYKPGLEGMRRFDEALGSPSARLKCVHVAGTNGKGSVCSMTAACLAACGLKVGLYTSPHLLDFRERMKIIPPGGGSFRMIPRESVWDFLEENGPAMEGLSFFEITTGLAFKWFADEEVDVAVVEVGLGGLLDSTNIIVPEVAVVTSIGLDHCAILGDTRAEIAAQKAGIFKPGVPAVVGSFDAETGPVFERTASGVHCPLFFASEDAGEDVPALNERTARLVLDILGFPVHEDALESYKEMTGLRGRWEILSQSPLVICDIGHNPAALEVNFGRLEALDRPMVVVYGVMADKDLDSIIPFMPSDARYVLVSPRTSRSLPAEALWNRICELRPSLDCRTAPSVKDGVQMALEMASHAPESVIYIGGSTFVVSEAVTIFDNH